MTYGGNPYGSAPYASTSGGGGGTTVALAPAVVDVAAPALGVVVQLVVPLAPAVVNFAAPTVAVVTGYRGEVLADNPLFYWRLGEPSGTTAADETGNGRAGTYVNTPTLGATGIPGAAGDTAATFDPAQSEKVTIADAAWMDVTNLTFECWVKVADMPNSSVNLLANRELAFQLRVVTGTGTASIDARVFGTDLIYVDLDTIASGVTVDDNQWHHIVLTHDGSTARIYIDGTQRGSAALAYNVNASTWAIDAADPYGLSMTVDEVAYYGTALSAARISAHYSAGSATTPTTVALAPAVVNVAAPPISVAIGTAVLLRPAVVEFAAPTISLPGSPITVTIAPAVVEFAAPTVITSYTQSVRGWIDDWSQGTGGVCVWDATISLEEPTPAADAAWQPIRTNRVTWPALEADPDTGRPVVPTP